MLNFGSGLKRTLEQVMDCLFAFFAQVPGPRTHECLMFDYRQALHPAVTLPCEPGIPVLIEHAQGAVEKFRQFNSPPGSPFHGIVWLNPANRKDLKSIVHHMENYLHDFSDRLGIGIGPIHAHANDFHAYVASLQFFGLQDDEAPVSGGLMPVIGKVHFHNTPFFSLGAEFGLGTPETSAVKSEFTCLCHSILQFVWLFTVKRSGSGPDLRVVSMPPDAALDS
jgi:hypothetical protein